MFILFKALEPTLLPSASPFILTWAVITVPVVMSSVGVATVGNYGYGSQIVNIVFQFISGDVVNNKSTRYRTDESHVYKRVHPIVLPFSSGIK